jgi:hypothetical protein
MTDFAKSSAIALPEAPGDVEWSEYHLVVLDPEMPFERFERLIHAASGISDAMRYWIGDLLLYGRGKYKQDVYQVLGQHGVSDDQANRYRLVSERIAGSRRRRWGQQASEAEFRLHWTHLNYLARFTEVAEQESWFARTLEKRWSPSMLRAAMRDAGALERVNVSGLAPKSSESSLLVDAARGVGVLKQTLADIGGGLDPDTAEAAGITQAATALEDVARVVRRAANGLSMEDAVGGVLEFAVKQQYVADPAYIVPAVKIEALQDAYDRATGARR